MKTVRGGVAIHQRTRRNASGFRGVYWSKSHWAWKAEIKRDGRRLVCGIYATATEAALAYDFCARIVYGDDARLNLPGQSIAPEPPPRALAILPSPPPDAQRLPTVLSTPDATGRRRPYRPKNLVAVDGPMARLYVRHEAGYVAVWLDASDVPLIAARTWRLARNGYVHTGGTPELMLHRVVMGVTDARITVHHRRQNLLDNRRAELEILSTSQHARMRRRLLKRPTAGQLRAKCAERFAR